MNRPVRCPRELLHQLLDIDVVEFFVSCGVTVDEVPRVPILGSRVQILNLIESDPFLNNVVDRESEVNTCRVPVLPLDDPHVLVNQDRLNQQAGRSDALLNLFGMVDASIAFNESEPTVLVGRFDCVSVLVRNLDPFNFSHFLVLLFSFFKPC